MPQIFSFALTGVTNECSDVNNRQENRASSGDDEIEELRYYWRVSGGGPLRFWKPCLFCSVARRALGCARAGLLRRWFACCVKLSGWVLCPSSHSAGCLWERAGHHHFLRSVTCRESMAYPVQCEGTHHLPRPGERDMVLLIRDTWVCLPAVLRELGWRITSRSSHPLISSYVLVGKIAVMDS